MAASYEDKLMMVNLQRIAEALGVPISYFDAAVREESVKRAGDGDCEERASTPAVAGDQAQAHEDTPAVRE